MPTKHPYQVMLSLSPEAYAALKADIQANGVQIPADVDEAGNYLDGIHRQQICDELGIDCPTRVRPGLTEAQKRAYAWRVNLMRRHLSKAQKRQLAGMLRAEGWTQEAIAQVLAIGQATVSRWIDQFIQTDNLPQPDTIQGKDGKAYPSRKGRRRLAQPAERADPEDHTPTPPASADDPIGADTGARPPAGLQARAAGHQPRTHRQAQSLSAMPQAGSNPLNAREARRPDPDGRQAPVKEEPTTPPGSSPWPSTDDDAEEPCVDALRDLSARVHALQGQSGLPPLRARGRRETAAWCVDTIRHVKAVLTAWEDGLVEDLGEAVGRDGPDDGHTRNPEIRSSMAEDPVTTYRKVRI